ncbi:O-acetyl-ADP-ribose deacetylase (regulator of RNase III), contains Macro domain [Acetitomaculum ruminis DSM 5522]|uniref:O-acetyl-ADP-ribose deacetylase (Regulator of RNase III), contains Macro domain n=1 Tax=Acetitomaculum ruminis DSM 5522 TaxID=1120918 RepID=A0A1I0XBW0_9FIRM|nr:protein-ADP-ribose hydrolase [Acetitomaculum ruminis]SFA97906.1 O-acetyl-ADP-ribose deacetylase (regulator of RNase III), contains Macro domain [Acetitomaculum ruminis DSM 5522]
MNQDERRRYLITELLKENPRYNEIEIPTDIEEQKTLLRGLMNIRMAAPMTGEFENIQNEYLKECLNEKGIVHIEDLEPVKEGIYLWKGDITRLATDAVVNAANSEMTGCYQPNHDCIDNCIHTYAGIQLRNFCQELMDELKNIYGKFYEEQTGIAKITPAYNLPCKYVIHTVGPVVKDGNLTAEHEELLRSCYVSCLDIAELNELESIALCCVSTGTYMFPEERAAQIAVETVNEFKESKQSKMKIIFNVYRQEDYQAYKAILG